MQNVSINLTTQMLATLFGFPFEDRTKPAYWSDVATSIPGHGLVDSEEQRMQIFTECGAYFSRLWNERVNSELGNDLLSMLAHDDRTRSMLPGEFLGHMILLIVSGNDTTRNSMTGGVLALNQNSREYEKLSANTSLIGASMIPEGIRWQTPLAHMCRTALDDTELAGNKNRLTEAGSGRGLHRR